LLVQTCFICNTIPQHLCPTCQTNASRPARRARPSGGHVVHLLIDWPVTVGNCFSRESVFSSKG